jgi:ATP-dependent Clp protease ATP-binding subunit ClpB
MSEYMEKHAVSRMIGAPPGYVGYDEGGQLTEQIRRRPYSVVLFDEIEKAHPDIFNAMLQILDDGRLTDGQGRVIDFRNAVIIMTSNIGSHVIAESKNAFGFSVNQKSRSNEETRKSLLDALRQSFRPEFLNRVDDIIVFSQLSRENLSVLIDLQLNKVASMLAERGVKLEIAPEAKEIIMNEGYDEAYGARPMRRAIQRLVQNPLALRLLAGDFLAGETVLVEKDGDEGKLKFVKQTEAVPAYAPLK